MSASSTFFAASRLTRHGRNQIGATAPKRSVVTLKRCPHGTQKLHCQTLTFRPSLATLFRTLLVFVLSTCLAGQGRCQSEDSNRSDTPESLLQADLREALSLLQQKRFRMLAHDFLPHTFTAQREYKMSQGSGGPEVYAMSDAMVAELTSHLNAALSGETFYNRNRSLVEISYVRKPVEIAPETMPGMLRSFGDRPSGKISGLGSDLLTALTSAVKMLEAGKTREFVEHIFPLPELAQISDGVSFRRYVERMKASPQMVEAMIRDLQQAAKGDIKISGNSAQVTVPGLSGNTSGRILKFELVEGNWRLYDNGEKRAEHRRLATAKIGSLTTEERRSSMMLMRYQDNWRLISMPAGLSFAR